MLQQILIDGSGHLLGRLASVIAKAVLSGKHFNSANVLLCQITCRHSTIQVNA